MQRIVVTFVDLAWPLKWGVSSVGVENDHIPFPESKRLAFSAATSTLGLQERNVISCGVHSFEEPPGHGLGAVLVGNDLRQSQNGHEP